DVELSTGDVHRSTLAVIDAHGYIRSYYLGTPDVDGQLAPELAQLLNGDGEQLLRSHGSGWGLPQVLDSLRAIGGLRQPGSGDLCQVGGLPTTVFVRSDGSIEGRYLGETNEQILGPHISAIGA